MASGLKEVYTAFPLSTIPGEVQITCLVTDNGSDPVGDHDWGNDSFTHCPECGFGAKLTEFHTPHVLPPDPDGLNDRRSEWAGHAVAAFREATGTDEADALCDLLADLMHWADRHHSDFAAKLLRSRDHYEAETRTEDSDPVWESNGRCLTTPPVSR